MNSRIMHTLQNRFFLHYRKPMVCLLLIPIFLLNGCQTEKIQEVLETQANTSEPQFTQIQSSTPFSVFLSPCDLIDQQYFYDTFADSTLFFSFEEGLCRVTNQWDTKTIQFSFSQGQQADQAIRWYTKKMVKGWSRPELLEQIDSILKDGEGKNLEEFQSSVKTIYSLFKFRNERVFSVGDSSYWYTYPEAQASILESSENDIYVHIAMNGFFSEEALETSLALAKIIYQKLPQRFSINFNYGDLQLIENREPTTIANNSAPFILSVIADKANIYYGDLCANESSNILVRIDQTNSLDAVYLVYRLTSNGETNDNWITKKMNKMSNGLWELPLSAENDFGAYKISNGAQVEYSISIIYDVSSVISSPTYRDIRVNQCVIGN